MPDDEYTDQTTQTPASHEGAPLPGDAGESPLHWDGRSTNFDDFRRRHPKGTDASLVMAAVESANDAIIITEAQLDLPGPRIEFVNPAFERMTGYSMGEVIGQTPRILQGKRTDNGLIRRLRSDLQSSRTFHGETINYRKDGSEYHVEWRITPLTDDKGNVVKWVAIQRDVSDRVRGEIERERLLKKEQQARADAEYQSKIKDEFLATLSHELRTPLTAIIGWSSMLRRKPDAAQLADGLTVIERNARAQAQLIEDLLDMSRIVTGKLRLDAQRVDLPGIIDAAIASVVQAAAVRDVKIVSKCRHTIGHVIGDATRLQQVFWNLLSNAVKFSPSGSEVRLDCARTNSHIEVSVVDHGAGISDDFLPFVFERFRQADGSTTREHGGLGLGLAIVKQLVDLHGGTVTAKSAGVGHGATFCVALPLVVDPSDNTDPSTAARRPVADCEELRADLAGVRVLLVDDEADTLKVLEKMLTSCNATVHTASSAAQAMTAFDLAIPDVLVSDISMPIKDGYELIKEVRGRGTHGGRNVPAVAVTAFARPEDRRRALLAGFDMHIAKPIDFEEFVAVVERLASRRVV